ncbi:L,D-transpeptidase family protein [Hansschlegelia sp.]|uniref:L,D-transpeptidase family protein n=1 Tax=Hansschlegelia sp. TaxID=2041892 RepID=UPI002B7509BC|nr:L,D-transpeptidase family protein [Hansschlegelia sp.]HVI28614.1 L,D-transpeptidase family protein [Hansschlegelia sp.]
MSAARLALAAASLAVAVSLAGCKSEQATTARSIQPLSPQLVSLMTEKGMSPRDPILLRIYKEEAKAEIWKKRRSDGRYALLKTYDICRFSGKLGPKIKEGDKQAPEGFYSVGPAQLNPRSNYYLSFNIGYPNAYDRALGRTGTHVMMHGDCLSAGCYAMTDAQIAEIYTMAREAFAGGQKAFQVQALPFRMTAQNMARRRTDPNMAFWKNLKQGSDNFEVTRLEPKVDACGKKYVFNATPSALSTFEPSAKCPSYQVQPEIARAVAAKEKADNILIAQLSKEIPPAPEYVAQNGRMRRSLDEPLVQVASAAPVAQSYAAVEPELASIAPVKTAPAPMPPSAPVALNTAVATDGPQPSTVKGGGFFAGMFRGQPEPQTTATVAAPVQVAGTEPRKVATDQTPVMASSIGPAPASKPSAGIGGWLKGVLGRSEAPEAQPVAVAPSPDPVTPKTRPRSAEATTSPKANPRVATAFADYR